MYKLTNSGSILRLTDGSCIPTDPTNTDYSNYLEWVTAGNTALPADPIPAHLYQELRIAAYPPMSDYMDAIVKGDIIQQQAYIDKCIAVKLKYPKP